MLQVMMFLCVLWGLWWLHSVLLRKTLVMESSTGSKACVEGTKIEPPGVCVPVGSSKGEHHIGKGVLSIS